ncbi:MAG: ABC transporter substrate-binding protein [Butyrivibrio sp.]|nr:ABC transporter substrate-binding protein [Butyrivibrio sp.]
MNKRIVQTISLILAVCILSGCRLPFHADNRTEGEKKYPEFLTIDVFDVQANYQGLQRGWFAKIVKDKFNMQLNIIATNKESNGDAAYETMRASGRLGDIILTSVADGRLSELVREGIVLDFQDYIDTHENLAKYSEQIKITSSYANAEGAWAIPSEISMEQPWEPAEYSEPTNAPTLRWDLYKEVGFPHMSTLEDLLLVLKNMQDAAGKSDSGNDVYAFSLFRDWDGGVMQNAGALTALYGNDIQGFVMLNPSTGKIESIADRDSAYFRALHFLFEANQMGLVDPESPVQNYETVALKMRDGAVLYSFWPWMGISLYNSKEHMSGGKGFASVVINDASYLCWGSDSDGKQNFAVMIGAETKDKGRMVDFVDWLYSDEGIECLGSPTGDFRGPEGLTWENVNGVPTLTEFGIDVFVNMDTDIQVPSEYGEGTWREGASSINFKPVDQKVTDRKGIPFRYSQWQDYQDRTATIVSNEWQKHYSTDKTPLDYYMQRKMLTVIPGTEWAAGEYPEYLQTVEEQCRQIIVDYSWRLVYAADEEDFLRLKEEMIDTLDRLEFNELVEVNIQSQKERYELFQKVISDSSEGAR